MPQEDPATRIRVAAARATESDDTAEVTESQIGLTQMSGEIRRDDDVTHVELAAVAVPEEEQTERGAVPPARSRGSWVVERATVSPAGGGSRDADSGATPVDVRARPPTLPPTENRFVAGEFTAVGSLLSSRAGDEPPELEPGKGGSSEGDTGH